MYDKPYTIINNSLNNFLPSTKPHQLHFRSSFVPLEQELRYHRWLVILGDPGSGKTTVLRWITRVFAEAASQDEEEITFEQRWHVAVRIPILIQISEFVNWLEQHPTKTLMDYIGDQMWDGERYCRNENKNVLKEVIDYGHALILIDGLDEIFNVERRYEIVDRVRKFIDEYVRTPEFISAFDDATFHKPIQPDWMRKNCGNAATERIWW
ncbi:unnamed protein product [Rotaria sp. Silwood1]|nr:unnamed protein product [Rotaria sp. Silwood1]